MNINQTYNVKPNFNQNMSTEFYKKHISKTSYIWLILIFFFIILTTYDRLINGQFLGSIVMIILLGLTWYFTFTFPTYYIKGDQLIIKELFETKKIQISSIKKIEKNQTKSFISFWIPAESGLLVYYNKYDEILLSPKHQIDFLNNITIVNPNIIQQ